MEMIRSRDKVMDLSQPRIMGILNMTPDSFYDGGRQNSLESGMLRVGQMLDEGVDMIDVGGMSSRPGAKNIDEKEEIKRVVPIIEAIRAKYPELLISIDTFRSKVAKEAIEAGADVVNDISAGELDPDMLNLVAERQVAYIMMHMKGTPEIMQDNTQYKDVVSEVLKYLLSRVKLCQSLGINDLIIDPGFGFGKSLDQNYDLLNKMEVFSIIDKPLLAGLSRKSMIYKLTGSGPEEALSGSIAANMIALQKGARILRVHDVKATADLISIWKKTIA